MRPTLKRGEFCKLRLFGFILIVNNFRIVVIGFEDALGNDLQAAGHPHKLSLQVMLLQSIELRRGEHLAIQMASEVLLDLPRHFDMVWCDEWQFYPFCTDQIIGHPKGIVVDAFSSLLSAFYSVLKGHHLAHYTLDYVVIQVAAEYLPPETDFFHVVPLCKIDQMLIDQRHFLLRQRNSRPLQLLALQSKLLQDIPLLLHFPTLLSQRHQHFLYIFPMVMRLRLRLLGQVGKMDDILRCLGVLDSGEHAGKMRNNLRILKQGIFAAQLCR